MVNLPVFDPQKPETAHNLGWLLLNRQLSDAALCSILLGLFRVEIERLATALLPSQDGAAGLVDQAILKAILNRQSFTGEVPGKVWLFALVLEEFASRVPDPMREIVVFDLHPYEDLHFDPLLQSLEKKQALLLALRYAHGFTLEEIAFILKQPIEPLQAIFAGIRERLASHQRDCVLCAAPDGSLSVLEAQLRAQLSASRPLDTPDEKSLKARGSSILASLSRQRETQRSRLQKKRMIQTGIAAVVLLGIGWLSMFAGAAQAPAPVKEQALVHPPARAQKSTQALPNPLHIQPTLPEGYQPGPSLHANQILQVARSSPKNWKTVWADVQITRYRPAGSGNVEQPATRKQIWVNQPTYARVISGPQTGQPAATYTLNSPNGTGQDFQTGQTFTEHTTEWIPDPDLQKLLVPEDMFPSGGTYTLAGSQPVANRQAWVLQWELSGGPLYRFWVDMQSGVILQRQEYAGPDLTALLAEITIRAITFDAPLAPAIFQPFQYQGNHFASNYSGVPEIADFHTLLVAPPVSNPLRAPGKDPLLRSNLLSCEQSPDGSQIAYASINGEQEGDTILSVTNNPFANTLPANASPANVPAMKSALPGGITAGDYTFAPDSRRLAFCGCERASRFCGVFILDTDTGRRTQLHPLNYADYMIWSPDGQSIALVGLNDTSQTMAAKASANLLMNELMALAQNWHFLVIDASSGEITYKRDFSWTLPEAPPDSPTHSWDTSFKVRLSGPDRCLHPQAN